MEEILDKVTLLKIDLGTDRVPYKEYSNTEKVLYNLLILGTKRC